MRQTDSTLAALPRPAVLVLAALVTLLPAAAGADNTDLAKRYFKLGEELYNRADYAGALEQFSKAHKHSGKPEMLFNIGRCQESLGQHDAAIKTYRAFLASGPLNREQVEARIANLERQSNRTPAAVGAAPAAAQAAQPATPPPPRQQDPPRRSSAKGLIGWISAGSGAALLVTGVVLGALAQGKAEEMEEANKAGDIYADHRDVEAAGQDLQLGQIVTLAAGGAALVAGGVLLYLHYRAGGERPQNAAWFAPAPARGGALVSGGFRF